MYSYEAVVFDLDGVITKTAKVHAAAWKKTFDNFLKAEAQADASQFVEFTTDDYLKYVDGKPRYEGVKSFLESRSINLAYGSPTDTADQETVCGIGNQKNDMFLSVLESDGVEVYESTVEFIKQLKAKGIHVGVASSSKNCKPVLEKAGLLDLFETRVDGVVSADLGLKGKPESDIFIRAALNMGVHASKAVVVEDATSGVAAGRNGGFALVLGIAREDNREALFENGADLVVDDMSQISLDDVEAWFKRVPPTLEEVWDTAKDVVDGLSFSPTGLELNPSLVRSMKSALCGDKKPVFFLDYDGTLTPIVSRPEDAKISQEMRDVVKTLCEKYTVAIVSGRFREDVQGLLGIDGLVYAGSHGFDILGPDIEMINPDAQKTIPVIASMVDKVKAELGAIEGVIIEDKKFSLAVHYRLVDEDKHFEKIQSFCQSLVEPFDNLRLMHGKKVFEILPALDWDKGKAVRFVLKALGYSWDEVAAVYIGDDTTDEDAFRMVKTRGLAVLVSEEERPSVADFTVDSPLALQKLFEKLIDQA